MTRSRRPTGLQAASLKMAELGLAAPVVMAHRLTRMALAGPQPSARDRQEFTGMVWEKPVALGQAWMAAYAQGLRWQQQWLWAVWTGQAASLTSQRAGRDAARVLDKALAPIHRKAVANARRLSR